MKGTVPRWSRLARLAVLAALLATSCSSSGGTSTVPLPGKPPATARVAPAPRNAGSASGLGIQRFHTLDAIFVAELPTDRFKGVSHADPSEVLAAMRPVSAACAGLDGHDTLVASYRQTCPLAAQFIQQSLALSGCSGRSACLTAVDKLRHTRQAALDTPAAAYDLYRLFDRGLALLQRATPVAIKAAQSLLAQVPAIANRLPSMPPR